MAMSKEDILEAVGAMSVMELNDLVKAFEEKFGVSAAAMAVAGPAGGAAAGGAAAEEQTEFTVVLSEFGSNKVAKCCNCIGVIAESFPKERFGFDSIAFPEVSFCLTY